MQHIIILALILLSAPTWAQKPLSQEALQKELAPFQKITKIHTPFEQTRHIPRWETTIKTRGLLKFNKEPQFEIIWEIQEPEYSALKLTQDSLALKSQPEQKNWQAVKNPKVSEQLKPLFSWLTFDAQAMSSIYDVYRHEANQFTLIPKDPKVNFAKILLWGKKGRITKLSLIEKSNDKIDIEFRKTRKK